MCVCACVLFEKKLKKTKKEKDISKNRPKTTTREKEEGGDFTIEIDLDGLETFFFKYK